MPLNWNVENVKDYKEKDPNERDAVIFTLMGIGINEITPKNIDQVYARVYAWENTIGPMRRYVDTETDEIVEKPFTREELESWTGIYTNVSLDTKAQFRKKLTRYLEDHYLGTDW
jgi:hypothetical protein